MMTKMNIEEFWWVPDTLWAKTFYESSALSLTVMQPVFKVQFCYLQHGAWNCGTFSLKLYYVFAKNVGHYLSFKGPMNWHFPYLIFAIVYL